MHDVYMVYIKNTKIAQIRFILLQIIIYEYYETSLNPKKKQYHKA